MKKLLFKTILLAAAMVLGSISILTLTTPTTNGSIMIIVLVSNFFW